MAEEDDQNDYLNQNDQEVNEEYDEDGIHPNFDSCKSSEETWNLAAANGMTFPAKPELEKAVEDIKQLIYLLFFQTGPKEKVHDSNVLNEYVKFLGLFYKAIRAYLTTRRPINIGAMATGQVATLKEGMTKFFEILYKQAALPADTLQNSLRDQFLQLHFQCFPYCHDDQCLSMD